MQNETVCDGRYIQAQLITQQGKADKAILCETETGEAQFEEYLVSIFNPCICKDIYTISL